MTDFKILASQYPAIRSYIRHRRWNDRSGTLAYAPNMSNDVFSTDGFGFRKGVFAGKIFDLSAAFSGGDFALVLGSSHVFGFGLETDAHTIPSYLSTMVGIPCINISFPEAQLQSLYAVVARVCMQASKTPAFIALLPGGTLTRYAFTRSCDPLFGVTDFRKGASRKDVPGGATETAQFRHLLAYSQFWTSQIAALAQSISCPFVIHPEITAFEKPILSTSEIACKLTVPISEAERLRFETHQIRYGAYTSTLIRNSPDNVQIVRSDPTKISFFDEFHYRSDGTEHVARIIAHAVA